MFLLVLKVIDATVVWLNRKVKLLRCLSLEAVLGVAESG